MARRKRRESETGSPGCGWLLAVVTLLSCSPPTTSAPATPNTPPPPRASVTRDATSAFTRSPQAPTSPVPLSGTCHGMDAGLVTVASRVAQEVETSGRSLSADALAFELRRAGLPYVWPTVFTATGHSEQAGTLRDQLSAWLASLQIGGEQRCGVAVRRFKDNSKDVVVAIVVDVVADVLPVPRASRAHAPIDVAFALRNHVTPAKLLALGPAGLPQEVVTNFDPTSGRLTANVSFPDRGRWLLQLLANVDASPRPVAEVEVWVDTPIPASFASSEVPGESAANGETTDALDLARMLNAARQSERLPALAVDPELSALAEAHAVVMRGAELVSHDAGDGDPSQRLQHYRLPDNTPKGALGENVARATSLRGAHRALWQSPAHRQTLLYKAFTHLGVGVALGLGGEVWVCELFVGPGTASSRATK